MLNIPQIYLIYPKSIDAIPAVAIDPVQTATFVCSIMR